LDHIIQTLLELITDRSQPHLHHL